MKKISTITGILCLCYCLTAQLQWTSLNGPDGVYTQKSFFNSSYSFVHDDFQLFRTADGLQWEKILEHPASQIVVGDHFLAVYHEKKLLDKILEIKLLISADQGESWIEAKLPTDAYTGENQVLACSHGIYFKTKDKLYRSQSNGLSWKIVSYDGLSFSALFSEEDKIWGKSGLKIFEFNAQSGKWIFSWNSPEENFNGDVYIKGETIIVIHTPHYYCSFNKGKTWKKNQSLGTENSIIFEKNNVIYFHRGTSIRYSEDMGQSWSNIMLNKDYQSLSLAQNKFLLHDYSKGCFVFDEINRTYAQSHSGLHSSPIEYLAYGDNQIWALGENYSLNRYDMNLSAWFAVDLPIENNTEVNVSINPMGYILCSQKTWSNVYLSMDRGVSWQILNITNNCNTELAAYWLGNSIALKGRACQSMSFNLGESWKVVHPFSMINFFKGKYWVINHSKKLSTSSDEGITWDSVDTRLEDVLYLYSAEDRLFAINLSRKLFSSADGISWEFIGDGLESMFDRTKVDLEFSKQNGHYVLADYHSGLYVLNEFYNLWEQVEFEYYISYCFSQDAIFKGSYSGGGVFKATLPTQLFNRFSGTVFHDQNGDGIKNHDEHYLVNKKIAVGNAVYPVQNYFSLTDQEGKFEIVTNKQTYDTIKPVLISDYVESISPPFYVLNDTLDSYDFAIKLRPNITDGKVSGTYNIQPRSGKNLNIHLEYKNAGTLPISGAVSLKLDPAFNFIKSSPQPDAIIGDSLVWWFDNLAGFGESQILVEGELSFFLAADSLIQSIVQIFPDEADQNTTDNIFIIQDKVGVNSNTFYRKRVNPPTGMTVAEMMEGKELEYTIYFQNPTDREVKDVQISDRLFPELDINTVRIIGSSHTITKWEVLPTGILKVYFDDANLPPANPNAYEVQGFFKFGIRIRKDNRPTFFFANTASIILDDLIGGNTNSVQTRWIEEVITGTKEITEDSSTKLSIIPNPASQNCYLRTAGRIRGGGTVRIFNANGQVISSQIVQDLSKEIEIQTHQLSNGFYLVTAEGAEGIMHGKLIIQK